MTEKEIADALREKAQEWNSLMEQARGFGLYVHASAKNCRQSGTETNLEMPCLTIHRIKKTMEY